MQKCPGEETPPRECQNTDATIRKAVSITSELWVHTADQENYDSHKLISVSGDMWFDI